jgi:integrase
MTDTAISPLRRRMIEDMTIRQFKASTQHTYVRFVKDFSIFFGRSPNKATFEDVRRYQLHLISRGVSPCTINATMTALRFFFRITVRRFDIANHIPLVPQPRKLPVILSPEEVARLLERTPKYKAALAVAYGAGLRISEIVSLKVSDIDSKRMLIRVELGKGRKDRYAMLSPHLLELLRNWWPVLRPKGYLFPGQDRIARVRRRVPWRRRPIRRRAAAPDTPAALHGALHPPRCHRQQPTRRHRPRRRLIQMEGLSGRRTGTYQGDDARP